MHVSDILKTKGADVVATRPEETIAATARLLATHRIGAVLVKDAEGGIIGIISERDIVVMVASDGAAALDCKVEDCMTRDVISCVPGDTISAVMAQMTAQRIRHLPVLDDGALAGMISIGDVVKCRLEETQHEVDALRDYVLGAT